MRAMRMSRSLQILVIALVLLGLSPAPAWGAQLQAPSARPLGLQWSFPQHIPGYDDQAPAPYLVADQSGTVHAFNSIPFGKDRAVVYSEWTRENGWSTPVDILLSPLARQARVRGAYLDQAGIVHVIFFGGDDLQAGIYYAQAPLASAGDASAWTKVALIGEDAQTPTEAAITGDGLGNLFVIFSGRHDGAGLYSIYSSDGGRTWSEPSILQPMPDEDHWPWAVSLYFDGAGQVHAVWTLVGVEGNGDFIYYARQDVAGKQWSDPLLLASRDPGDYEVDWPAIIAYHGELMVVYDDSFPATRWMRRSGDGGSTWSEPTLLFNYVGEYERPALVVDSGDNLHMLLGNRTEDATHGLWHSLWLGDRWSDLEPVISGPRVTSGPLPQRFDPTAPRAVISQGNLLLVTWNTDPGAGRNGVWSAVTSLDTPALPSQPLPTLAPTPTATPWVSIANTGDGGPSALAPAADDPVVVQAPPTPGLGLTLAILPAALLVGAVLWIYRRRFRSRYMGAPTRRSG